MAVAFDHLAVHGKALAGPHPDPIALANLVDGQVQLALFTHHSSALALQVEQAMQGVRGSALGPQFQRLAQQYQADDHA